MPWSPSCPATLTAFTAAQWRLFTGWCDEVGLQWMQADPLTVARYLAVRAGTAALDTSPVADEAVRITLYGT